MEHCKCKFCEGKLDGFWGYKAPEKEVPQSVYEKLSHLSDHLETFTPQEAKNILNGLADEINSIDDAVNNLKNDSAHELALDRISKRLY
jgi:hypothetical protein